jgi:pentapeptide repeat protein
LKDHPLPSDNYLCSLAKLQEERFRGLPRRLTRRVKNRLLGRKPVTFTNLTDTKLAGANLTGAILANADLRHTRGSLVRRQIERAIGNDKTKLPDTDEFKPLPPRWTSKGIEEQIKEVEAQTREERKSTWRSN